MKKKSILKLATILFAAVSFSALNGVSLQTQAMIDQNIEKNINTMYDPKMINAQIDNQKIIILNVMHYYANLERPSDGTKFFKYFDEDVVNDFVPEISNPNITADDIQKKLTKTGFYDIISAAEPWETARYDRIKVNIALNTIRALQKRLKMLQQK